jgi:hypothetical protein
MPSPLAVASSETLSKASAASWAGGNPAPPPETIRQQMAHLRPAVSQLDFEMLGLLTQFDGDRLRLLFAFLFPAHVASADLPDHRKGNCYLCTAPMAQFSSDVACSECMHRLFRAIGSHCVVHQTFKQASRVMEKRHHAQSPLDSAPGSSDEGLAQALTLPTPYSQAMAFDQVVAELVQTLPPLEPAMLRQAQAEHQSTSERPTTALRHYGFRRGGSAGNETVSS